jgi:hypothetical protein
LQGLLHAVKGLMSLPVEVVKTSAQLRKVSLIASGVFAFGEFLTQVSEFRFELCKRRCEFGHCIRGGNQRGRLAPGLLLCP